MCPIHSERQLRAVLQWSAIQCRLTAFYCRALCRSATRTALVYSNQASLLCTSNNVSSRVKRELCYVLNRVPHRPILPARCSRNRQLSESTPLRFTLLGAGRLCVNRPQMNTVCCWVYTWIVSPFFTAYTSTSPQLKSSVCMFRIKRTSHIFICIVNIRHNEPIHAKCHIS